MKTFFLSSVRPFYRPDDETGSDQDEVEEKKVEEKSEEKKVEEKKEDPPEGKEDWRDKEIGRKHRQNQDLKAENERLKQEAKDRDELLARRKKGPDGDDEPPQKTGLTQEDVKREAARQRAQETYDEQCNSAYADGRDRFKDKFELSITRIGQLGGVSIEDMTSILGTDDPAKVLLELGQNPEKYHKIMGLPEARRRNEIAKLGMKTETTPPKKTVSDAETPVDDVEPRAARKTEELSDKDTDDDWYRKREAQVAARKKPFRAARV